MDPQLWLCFRLLINIVLAHAASGNASKGKLIPEERVCSELK